MLFFRNKDIKQISWILCLKNKCFTWHCEKKKIKPNCNSYKLFVSETIAIKQRYGEIDP